MGGIILSARRSSSTECVLRQAGRVATQDRDLRLTGDKFLNVPWGIGIRKGDTAMSRWVNAALRYMKKKDEFVKILRANAPARLVPDFLDNVPRPKNTFVYPVGKDVASICP